MMEYGLTKWSMLLCGLTKWRIVRIGVTMAENVTVWNIVGGECFCIELRMGIMFQHGLKLIFFKYFILNNFQIFSIKIKDTTLDFLSQK